jgi:DNA-binding NarL/FixJ family response regulator
VHRPIHVLLVENDPLMAFNTKRSLRRHPKIAAITVAVDGREALDHLRGGIPAGQRPVVLTDLWMPRMSGLELVSALRAEPALRDVVVVVFTISTDEADRDAALALHVAGYFTKPAASRQLDEVVTCLCASRSGG